MDLLPAGSGGSRLLRDRGSSGRRPRSGRCIALALLKPSLLQLGEPKEKPDYSKESEIQQRRCHCRTSRWCGRILIMNAPGASGSNMRTLDRIAHFSGGILAFHSSA
jgi:hypothetical protein